jgi:NAD(P)-dependent dehydrogenase (short-subunit alcohol dehydrogenase family)
MPAFSCRSLRRPRWQSSAEENSSTSPACILSSAPDWFLPTALQKGALVQLTKSMAIELAPFNVQVNAIAPGWIETDMTESVKTMPLYQEVIARTPAGRFGVPDECAGTAVFLA